MAFRAPDRPDPPYSRLRVPGVPASGGPVTLPFLADRRRPAVFPDRGAMAGGALKAGPRHGRVRDFAAASIVIGNDKK
jgi:hypothetical protein